MAWDYQYDLPPELIAQTPASPRDHSRLLVINRRTGQLQHRHFYDLPHLLQPSDVLVFNQSQVIPARLFGTKSTGGKVEVLLLRKLNTTDWQVISHPGLKPGQTLIFPKHITAQVISSEAIQFINLNPDVLNQIGKFPLPPYIHSRQTESILRRQYQTVYATEPGSAAAPTAGLHFTRRLFTQLTRAGIQTQFVTLHVGLGTFKSPTPEQIASKTLHEEFFSLSPETALNLNQAKAAGRRIIAVGTTATRVLETCSSPSGKLVAQTGDTHIFIQPPYRFKSVDGLITNFHLPGSSLIMLVSAFTTPSIIRSAYQTAVSQNYRFFSFGDATFIH